MNVKNTIKELRECGQTSAILGVKMGISERTILRWEAGDTRCGFAEAQYLSRLLSTQRRVLKKINLRNQEKEL